MKTILNILFAICQLAFVTQRASAGEITPYEKQAAIYLLQGDETVETMVDWEKLMVNGEDFGSKYTALPSSDMKRRACASFIVDLSKALKASGAWNTMDNWRRRQVNGKIFVAGKCSPSHIMAVTFNDVWPYKIVAITIRKL